MAGSKKPYPCCGRETYGRPVDQVICHGCRALMSLGRAYKKHLEGALDEPETILVRAPSERDWDAPSFFTRHTHGDPFKSIGEMIKRLIFTLAVKARHFDDKLGSRESYRTLRQMKVDILDDHKPEQGEAFHLADGHKWNSTEPILINKENKELLEELIKAIGAALKEAEAGGVKYGRHQLKQLVDGEITASELSETS